MPRPSPPANVVASDGSPTVFITWDAVADAIVYTIYRSTAQGSNGSIIGRTNELTWNDTTAIIGVIYWYSVSVTVSTDRGCSALSTQDSGYAYPIHVSAPAAPVVLSVTVI